MKTVYQYLKLMRIHHYIKNLLIFLPILFSKNLNNFRYLQITCLGYISFCLMSSVVYIFNDIQDIENDKKHGKKKERPLAAGTISIKQAYILAGILCLMSLICNTFANNNWLSFGLLIGYMGINMAYSIQLKHIPIVDIAILALGFLIRVLYGAVITHIEISNWLYLTIVSFSFYMGLGKRRNELRQMDMQGRKVLEAYNTNFLSNNMYVYMTLGIVFYALWCIDINKVLNPIISIVWTVPFVCIICMKYSFNIEREDSSGDPVDVILKDKILLGLGMLYGIILCGYIYFL